MEISLTNISKEFLTTYSPKNLAIQFKGIKGVKDVLTLPKEVRNLYGLRTAVGEDKVVALLKLQLIDLNEVLGLKQPFNERQIDEISTEIVASYSFLTMADIYLVFRRIKTGFYGELYDRLLMPTLFSFFADYFSERCQEAERQNQAQADRYKSLGYESRSSGKEKEACHIANVMNMQRMGAKKK